MQCLPRNLPIEVHKVRYLPRNLHFEAPATKSALRGSQVDAPARKSTRGSRNAVPATKSTNEHYTMKSERLDDHEPPCPKCGAYHEICISKLSRSDPLRASRKVTTMCEHARGATTRAQSLAPRFCEPAPAQSKCTLTMSRGLNVLYI